MKKAFAKLFFSLFFMSSVSFGYSCPPSDYVKTNFKANSTINWDNLTFKIVSGDINHIQQIIFDTAFLTAGYAFNGSRLDCYYHAKLNNGHATPITLEAETNLGKLEVSPDRWKKEEGTRKYECLKKSPTECLFTQK